MFDTPSALASLAVITLAVFRGLRLWERRTREKEDAQYVKYEAKRISTL